MKIEISNGEIIDKLTIIKIKLERIKDDAQLINLKKEYDELIGVASSIMNNEDPLFKELYKLNCDIWDLGDIIYDFERKKEFGSWFIAAAREIHLKNDKRTELKKRIDIQTSSKLIEEKSYGKYHLQK